MQREKKLYTKCEENENIQNAMKIKNAKCLGMK